MSKESQQICSILSVSPLIKKPRERNAGLKLGEYGLFAILGFPVTHSLSPDMHNAAFRKTGLKNFYIRLSIPPSRFRRLLSRLKRAPLDGFNLTVPHKELVMKALSAVDAEARRIGAVNTVLNKKGRLIGYNTDAYGFITALKRKAHFSARGKSALILGAGGAARACVYALLRSGARRVFIANRTRQKAKKMVRDFSSLARKGGTVRELPLRGKAILKRTLESCNLLVNATSLGLKKGDPLPVPVNCLPKKKILVMDLIYNPPKTKLLAQARRRGHLTLNGEGMLLYQGARAFEIWTGRRAPVSVMERAIREHSGLRL